MSTAIDGNRPEAVIDPERIALFNELFARAQTFVNPVCVPLPDGREEISTMDMLLMGLCVCMFSLAVVAVAFGAATRSAPSLSTEQPGLQPAKATAPSRPIPGLPAAPPALLPQQVPIQLLLAQIENHVRLEQAAAESFIELPTQALLHSKTASPFVN